MRTILGISLVLPILLGAACGSGPPPPGLGVPVAGSVWQVTVEDVRAESNLLSEFGEKYYGSFVLVQTTFRALDETSLKNIPKRGGLLHGVRLFDSDPPPAAIALEDISVVSTNGSLSPIYGFAVGTGDRWLVAPNLTDLSVISLNEEQVYSFAFEVPENTSTKPMEINFLDLSPIPVTIKSR